MGSHFSKPGIPGEANREDDSDSYDLSGGIIGLILYNPTDRDGAELEADHLESGLRPHASHVIKNAWSTERELFQHMDIDIVGFSALVICISSHGMAGTLRCEDGDGAVAINDILFKLSRHLPCWMPLVCVIQCCQHTEIQAEIPHFQLQNVDAAAPYSADDSHHIVLQRPHTFLILSTIQGGYARRGAYTNAIAQQFMTADGKTDIHVAHFRAVSAMHKKYPGDWQTPELRSTLTKRLLIGLTGLTNEVRNGGSTKEQKILNLTRQLVNERVAREQDHLEQEQQRNTQDKEREKRVSEVAAGPEANTNVEHEISTLSQNLAAEQLAKTSLQRSNDLLLIRLDAELEAKHELERELRVCINELKEERQIRLEQSQAIAILLEEKQQAKSSLQQENNSLSLKLGEEKETLVELKREFQACAQALRNERQLRFEQAQAIVTLAQDRASQRQIPQIRADVQTLDVARHRQDNEMNDMANRVRSLEEGQDELRESVQREVRAALAADDREVDSAADSDEVEGELETLYHTLPQ